MTAAPTETAALGQQDAGTRTLPHLLVERATTAPDGVAFRHKRYGRWAPTTWREYAERVAVFAAGLRSFGVEAGDRVAIAADNGPEWPIADLAIQSLGAISVGLDPALEAAEVQALLAHSGAVAVVAEDEEQYDKVTEIRAALPALRTLVVIDPRGVTPDPTDTAVRTLQQVDAAGAGASVESLRSDVARVHPGDVATLVYERGPSGSPRAAQLTHANLLSAAAAIGAEIGLDGTTEVLSYLPLSIVHERVVSVAAPLAFGGVVCFGEGGETFLTDLQQVQPTFVLGIPFVFEQVHATVEQRMEDASFLKRKIYTVALARGLRLGAARREGRAGIVGRTLHGLWWLLLYRPLRVKLGLLRARDALCLPAPSNPATLEFFWALGVPVRVGWGCTENTMEGTLTPAGAVRLDTVGRAIEGTEVRIGDDGEICTRGPGTFAGWFRDDEASASAVDADGWLHTGDKGALDDDGFLRLDTAEAPA